MKPETQREIRNALRTIAENHAATMAVLERMLNDLASQLDGDQCAVLSQSKDAARRKSGLPYIDTPMLSVIHRGNAASLVIRFPCG